ncbi:hypothetical protein [Streptomyces sp. NPDC020742]|uniref:hypothetical protein n=1 Tax=Streptomyces sp. NPDC020742 TaxID=3154897 RepID=UPI0034064CC0
MLASTTGTSFRLGWTVYGRSSVSAPSLEQPQQEVGRRRKGLRAVDEGGGKGVLAAGLHRHEVLEGELHLFGR